MCVICFRIGHLRQRTNWYSMMTTCTIIVVDSYRPRGPSIVWEIPRVQSYILLINAGTSLQQIHKLSECDCALSLFPGILSSNVMLTSMSLHDPRRLSNHLPSLLIRAVFSQNTFIFLKDAALGLDHRCNCFQCVSFSVFRCVSCLFHTPCTPFWH